MIKNTKVPKTSVDELMVSLAINECRRDNPYVTNKFIQVPFVCILILCEVNMIHLKLLVQVFPFVLISQRIGAN